jgi:hypothetical protein
MVCSIACLLACDVVMKRKNESVVVFILPAGCSEAGGYTRQRRRRRWFGVSLHPNIRIRTGESSIPCSSPW